jgi:hypothetical protein
MYLPYLRLSIILRLPTIATLLFITSLAHAQLSGFDSRLDIQFYATTQYPMIQVDGMLPIYNDYAHNLHVDLQGQASTDSQAIGGIGVGYRQLINESGVVGGYLFTDRTEVRDKKYFTLINPGLEFLGARFNARINGYFPVGTHQRTIQSGFGEALGLNSSHFTGRNHFDAYYDQRRQIGAGADVLLGCTLNSNFKTQLGGYHYHFRDTHPINGALMGAQYWLNSYSYLGAQYQWDNEQHSVGTLSLGIRYGGYSGRITDPIQRHLATIGQGGYPSKTIYHNVTQRYIAELIATGQPIPNFIIDPDTGIPSIIIDEHVFFFRSDITSTDPITSQSCTYEAPCGPSQFNQTNLDQIAVIDPLASLYFNGGSYTAVGASPMSVPINLSLESRTLDFKQTAPQEQRTVFVGGFQLNGNNVLENISVQPGNGVTTGITAINDVNYIYDSVIGSEQSRYRVGLDLRNSSITISDNTQVFANAIGANLADQSTGSFANGLIDVVADARHENYGINATDIASLLLNNEQVNVFNDVGSTTDSVSALHIVGDASASVVNQTRIRLEHIEKGSVKARAFGIDVNNNANVTIRDSIVTVVDSDNTFATGDANAMASLVGNGNGKIDVTGSKIQIISNGGTDGNLLVRGILMLGSSQLNVTDSLVGVSSQKVHTLDGVRTEPKVNVNINTLAVSLAAPTGATNIFPVKVENSSAVIRNVVCILNGTQRSCS